MEATEDRILIIEHDPSISDLIGRQTLQSVGYRVDFMTDASVALSTLPTLIPDIILIDLHIPGLSGKDFLVALQSQGVETPVIVLARKGEESEAVQAFRLGACDYVLWPARDAEVLAAVERTLRQVHLRRARAEQTNQELRDQINALKWLHTLGKSLVGITDLKTICNKTVEASVQAVAANAGWLALADDSGKNLFLAAQHNLPAALANKRSQLWEDELSSEVVQSGKSIAINGPALKKKVSNPLGQAVLLTPLISKGRAVGVLGIARTTDRPFSAAEHRLLAGVADYAAQALVNAQRIFTLEERARISQPISKPVATQDKVRTAVLQSLAVDAHWFLEFVHQEYQRLADSQDLRIPAEQRRTLLAVNEKNQQAARLIDLMVALSDNPGSQPATPLDLVKTIQQEIPTLQRSTRQMGLGFSSDLSTSPLPVSIDAALLKAIFSGLVSYAAGQSQPHGTLRISVLPYEQNHGMVKLTFARARLENEKVIDPFQRPLHPAELFQISGNQGPSLAGIKEIITAYHGKIWIDYRPATEPAIHLVLPLCQNGTPR